MRFIAAGLAVGTLAVAVPTLAGQQPYGPPGTSGPTPPPPPEAPPGIDPQLDGAAAVALASYPALSAAEGGVRASTLDIDAARWLRYPSANVELATRDDEVPAISPRLEVFQPLWAGGRIDGTIDRATALREVARAQLGEAALEVLLRLATAYYDVVRTTRLADLQRTTLAGHRTLVASMERRVAQEVSPRTDLELALARTAQVEQDLAIVEAQRGAALTRLRELMDDPDYELAQLPLYDQQSHHAVDESDVDRAVACNPSVSRAEAQVSVAEADQRLGRAALLPQVGVQYAYDRFSGHQYGLALRAQTNGGLAPLAQAEAAGVRREASEFAATLARRQVGEAVRLDLVENRAAQRRLASSRVAADAAFNVTESFMRQFVAGRRTWLDLMNSVREAASTRAAMIEVETTAMASSARIHVRACEWRPDMTAAA